MNNIVDVNKLIDLLKELGVKVTKSGFEQYTFIADDVNIDYLNFVFYNERNELLTDLGDWLITMKITIKQH